jgi:hypothetical protein
MIVRPVTITLEDALEVAQEPFGSFSFGRQNHRGRSIADTKC